jgi:hypothetical protein
MDYYDNEDWQPAVARSCKFLNTGRTRGKMMEAASEGISCGICKSWDGTRCNRNVFDSVLSNLDNT